MFIILYLKIFADFCFKFCRFLSGNPVNQLFCQLSNFKQGGYNVQYVGLGSVERPSCVSRIMPKLDEYKWRYIILMFLVGTVGSWLVFGCIYTLIAHVSPACIADVANFSTAFLYAVEVQVTIGNFYIDSFIKLNIFICFDR